MTASVDERVVQMRFDNAQFEKGVATTIASLQKLDSSLRLKTGAKGLTGLSSAVKNLSFSSLSDGIKSFGSVASSVFSSVHGYVDTLGKVIKVAGLTAIGAATTQVMLGGAKRAANIENAKFQLAGLGVAWEEVKDSVDYAVKDTAYGMDEAAKASAQFVASGVALGNDMSTALRAISGAAAMTNSSYEDTARIFTTVAGNGRLMGDQLNQLGGRGLNAAATMANYFKEVHGWAEVTEEDIRTLTSKGEIDFKTFAEAMDWAFGEHAKKANETFNGAFANMKAALSRIGEPFFAAWREFGRQASLGAKGVFDNIGKGLKEVTREIEHYEGAIGGSGKAGTFSVLSSFQFNLMKMTTSLKKNLDELAASNVVANFVGSLVTPMDALFHVVALFSTTFFDEFFGRLKNVNFDDFGKAMDAVGQKIYKFGDVGIRALPKIGVIFDNIFGIVQNLASFLGSVLSPIGEAIANTFFGGVTDLENLFLGFLDAVGSVTGSIKDFVGSLELTEEQSSLVSSVIETLLTFFRNLGSAISSIGTDVFTALGDIFNTIGPAAAGFLDMAGSLLGPALEAIGNGAVAAAEGIGSFLKSLPKKIDAAVDFEALGEFFASIKDSAKEVVSRIDWAKIGEGIAAIGKGLADFGGDAVEKAKEFFESLSKIEVPSDVLEVLGSALSNVFSSVSDADSKSFDNVVDGVLKMTDGTVAAKSALDGTPTLIDKVFDSIQKGLGGLGFEDFLMGLSVLTSGFVVGNLIRMLISLSKFPTIISNIAKAGENLVKSVDSLIALPQTITGAIQQVEKSLRSFMRMEGVSHIIISIAIAIGVMAASMWAISTIPEDAFTRSLGSVLAFTAIIAALSGGLLFAMNKMDEKKLSAIGFAMFGLADILKSFAVAVGILAASVFLIGQLKPEQMLTGLFATVVLIGALALAASKLKGLEGQFAKLGVGLMGLGVAMILFAAAIGAISLIGQQNTAGLFIGLGVITTIVLGLGVIATKLNGLRGSFASAGAGILFMASGILVLTAAIAILGDIGVNNPDQLIMGIRGVVAVLIAIGVMGHLIQGSASSIAAAGAAMIGISVFLLTLTASIAALSLVAKTGADIDSAASVLATFLVIVGLLMAVLAVTNVGAGQGMAFAAMAVGILVLAGALMALSLVPADVLGSTALVLGLLAGALALIGIVATVASTGLWALAAVFVAMGLSVVLTGAGLMLIATGLTMLASIAMVSAEQIGLAMEIMAGHIANSIVIFLTTLAGSKDALATAGAELITGLAQGIGASLGAIATAGVMLILAFLQGIEQNIASIAATAGKIIANFILGIAACIGDIIQAAVMLGTMFIVGIADAINNNGQMVLDAVMALANTVGAALLDGLAGVVQLIPGVGEEWANSLRGTADEMRSSAETLSDSVHAKFDEMYGEETTKAGEFPDIMGSMLNKPESLEAAGEADGEGFSASFLSKLDSLPPEVKSTVQGAFSDPIDVSDSGEATGESYNTGTGDAMDKLSDIMSSKTEEAANTAGGVDSYRPGYGVGSSFGSGMSAGIGAWIGPIADKAREMVRNAKKAADDEADTGSPSKEMIKRGKWYGEGYYIGINSMIGAVSDVSGNMVASAMDSAEEAMSTMADAWSYLDTDASPVITPVLDLSDVESGWAMISSMLTSSPALQSSFLGTGLNDPKSMRMGNTVTNHNEISIHMENNGQINPDDVVLAVVDAFEGFDLLEGV